MKRLIFACFFTAHSMLCVAQFWSTIGNTGNGFVLGQNDNNPLLFITNDLERMRLTADKGWLGLGLQVPQSVLHIHSNELKSPIAQVGASSPLLKVNPYHYAALQITNGQNGTAETDGLHVGTIDNDAFIKLREQGSLFFYTKNSLRMSIGENGEVGIGTQNYTARLNVVGMNQNALSLLAVGNANHVIAVKTTQATTQLLIAERSNQVFFSIDGNGTIRSGLANTTFNTGSAAGQSLNWGTSYLGFNARRQNNTWLLNTDGANNGGGVIWGNVAGDIYFAGVPSTGAAAKDLPDAQINSNHTHMVIKGDGNVGIGTKNTYGFKLNVCGKIRAKELNIEANNWCDFVFHEDYVLLPLDARKEHLLLKRNTCPI